MAKSIASLGNQKIKYSLIRCYKGKLDWQFTYIFKYLISHALTRLFFSFYNNKLLKLKHTISKLLVLWMDMYWYIRMFNTIIQKYISSFWRSNPGLKALFVNLSPSRCMPVSGVMNGHLPCRNSTCFVNNLQKWKQYLHTTDVYIILYNCFLLWNNLSHVKLSCFLYFTFCRKWIVL